MLFLTIAVFVFVYTKLRKKTKIGGLYCNLHLECDTLPQVGICNIGEICRSISEVLKTSFEKLQKVSKLRGAKIIKIGNFSVKE